MVFERYVRGATFFAFWLRFGRHLGSIWLLLDAPLTHSVGGIPGPAGGIPGPGGESSPKAFPKILWDSLFTVFTKNPADLGTIVY